MIKSIRGHSLSLSARLTLLYTAVVLVAIALFAALTYWQFSSRFKANYLRFLQSEIAEQQTYLRESNGDPHALAREIIEETVDTKPRAYLARLYDENGQILAESPEMRRKLPATIFPLPVDIPLLPRDVRRQIILDPDDNDRDVFALVTARIKTGQATAPLYVQLALGITGDDKVLVHFRQALLFSFLVLAPLLLIAGRWIAARGLEPLRQIVQATRTVTPNRLSDRIPVARAWPAELQELVSVINAMLVRLEEAFTRMSRFSSDLAHELRTPLGIMSGELEVSLLRKRDVDTYQRTLESNLEECRRLQVLVENLLFVARAESTELALRRETIDVAELCEWVVAQLHSTAEERTINIEIEGSVNIFADPILVRQAIVNVLTNAIGHSPFNSKVTIAMEKSPEGNAKLAISDQGEGISPEHLPHIFDRFYQADTARNRKIGQGAGLGLAIVQTIMSMHDGTVEVISAFGESTTVTLIFPGSNPSNT